MKFNLVKILMFSVSMGYMFNANAAVGVFNCKLIPSIGSSYLLEVEFQLQSITNARVDLIQFENPITHTLVHTVGRLDAEEGGCRAHCQTLEFTSHPRQETTATLNLRRFSLDHSFADTNAFGSGRLTDYSSFEVRGSVECSYVAQP